jgi:BirA family biotin operon repressor/biotin-[acetyl-CoA-carboxylase] ligase
MLSPDARLLRCLRRVAPAFVSMEELAAAAGLDSDATRGAIDSLADAGWEIECREHSGCRLFREPEDALIADDIAERIEPCSVATRVLVFASTGSTNELAARLARESAAHGHVVIAEEQTAGRGRLGRKWDSPRGGGLWISIVVRPRIAFDSWHRLTLWAALGARGAIGSVSGINAKIKWPNDIYADGRKLAGVLVETGADVAGEKFAVVGIGINVAQTEFPAEIAHKAGSILQMTGRRFSRAALAGELLRQLDARWQLMESDFSALVSEATGSHLLLGQWIEVDHAGRRFAGFAEALDSEGFLPLRLGSGERVILRSGEPEPAA